jgi:hypothetical protein
MAVFPSQEMDVRALANAMIAGYTQYTTFFPHAVLPVLQDATDQFRQAMLYVVRTRAIANQATADKDTAFDALVANMKMQLARAEIDSAEDPVKLDWNGWAIVGVNSAGISVLSNTAVVVL